MNKQQIVKEQLNLINRHLVDEEIKVRNAILSARKIKDFLNLDNKRRDTILTLGKLPIGSKEYLLKQKEIEEINKECKKVLIKNNFNINLLKKNYNCPICKDTGYADKNMCICLKTKVQNALIKQSGLKNTLQFDFKQSDQTILEENPSLQKIYRFAHKYCENFPNNTEANLIFFGQVGTGKTFLLECIANELMHKLVYVVFCTAYELCSTMIKAYNSPYSEREAMLAPFFESDLLIIDDLGTEPLFHETAITNFYNVINERQRNNLPMIVSTNLTANQIDERYGNRIKSRLFNTKNTLAIRFTGDDLRLK